MTFKVFITLLSMVSVFTSLFTEGIEIILTEQSSHFPANTLASIIAILMSLIIFAGYLLLTETRLEKEMMFYLITLMLLSWLCALVGYDKVRQTLTQLQHLII